MPELPEIPEYPIVTFFASSPSGPRFPACNYSQEDSAGLDVIDNTFLFEVYDTLQQQGGVPTGFPITKMPHMLVRVASIQEIDHWLQAYFPDGTPPDAKLRMQVVGHAQSGTLALGSSWPDEPAPPKWHQELDSDPLALNLIDSFDGRIAELMLAGCYVASRVGNVNAVNGRTLLFTFAEMWHCKVRGASTNVSSDDFQHGWYVGRDHYPPSGWAWYVAGRPESVSSLVVDVPPLNLDAVPLPRPDAIAIGKHRLDGAVVNALCGYYNGKLPAARAPNLATVELAFDLVYGARRTRAILVCNGQFLGVATANGWDFYGNRDETDSPTVERLIDTLQTVSGGD